MFRTPSCFWILCSLLLTALLTLPASADTWTDSSGKFTVEAEYVGVRDSSVILRTADGKEISVPIARLSEESRAQAKRLWEMSRSAAKPSATSGSSAAAPGGATTAGDTASEADPGGSTAPASMSLPDRELNFTPPQPPAFDPMPEFPDDLSLQQTVDFVKTQITNGHPEVIWYALPGEMREKLNSAEFRDAVAPAIEKQAAVSKPIEDVLMKAVEVLVNKKQFVLNSQLLQQLPPPIVQSIEQAYDPAVGVVYELLSMQFAFNQLGDKTMGQVIDFHFARLGAHLKELIPLLPPGAMDQVLANIQVNQTSDTTGTIVVPNQQGGTETTEMVKYDGRWIPKDLADLWDKEKDQFIPNLVAQMEAANDPQAQQQAQMMVAMIAGTANGALEPLLQANTQEEFDQALMQLVGMLQMFGGQQGAGQNPGQGQNFGPPPNGF